MIDSNGSAWTNRAQENNDSIKCIETFTWLLLSYQIEIFVRAISGIEKKKKRTVHDVRRHAFQKKKKKKNGWEKANSLSWSRKCAWIWSPDWCKSDVNTNWPLYGMQNELMKIAARSQIKASIEKPIPRLSLLLLLLPMRFDAFEARTRHTIHLNEKKK